MQSLLMLLLATSSSALKFATGHVFVWKTSDLETLDSNRIRFTVLGKAVSDSEPADSGAAWRIVATRAEAHGTSPEIFQFHDGAYRTIRTSVRWVEVHKAIGQTLSGLLPSRHSESHLGAFPQSVSGATAC